VEEAVAPQPARSAQRPARRRKDEGDSVVGFGDDLPDFMKILV
jgi:hypothetical protein